MSRRLLSLLAERGPLAADEITRTLGITRTRMHGAIHKHGSTIVRFDLTPECGRQARPIYGLRPSLTAQSG